MVRVKEAEPKIAVQLEVSEFPRLDIKSIQEFQMALKSSITDAILNTIMEQELLLGDEINLSFEIAFKDQTLKHYLH